jgi:flagellar motor protein MotB
VGRYLEQSGINPRRVRLSVCGGFNPIDTDLTAEGRGRNRRVEIVVSEELVRDAVPGRDGL